MTKNKKIYTGLIIILSIFVISGTIIGLVAKSSYKKESFVLGMHCRPDGASCRRDIECCSQKCEKKKSLGFWWVIGKCAPKPEPSKPPKPTKRPQCVSCRDLENIERELISLTRKIESVCSNFPTPTSVPSPAPTYVPSPAPTYVPSPTPTCVPSPTDIPNPPVTKNCKELGGTCISKYNCVKNGGDYKFTSDCLGTVCCTF